MNYIEEYDLYSLSREQQEQAVSCMVWPDRRIDAGIISKTYIEVFKREWRNYVGSEELIPEKYKNRVMNHMNQKGAV